MSLVPLALTAILFLGAAAITCGSDLVPERPAWDGKTLTAHEWGTFTAVKGANGVTLDGLIHEERDLPEFVYDSVHVGLVGRALKMETPVIYFYSDRLRAMSVQVQFPRGKVTQWYPGASTVNALEPDTPEATPPPLRGGFIKWGVWGNLQILAPGATAPLEKVAADDQWQCAREVAANTIRIHNRSRSRREAVDRKKRKPVYEAEKYLFYRGLADFELPLTGHVHAEAVEGDDRRIRLDLENRNQAHPIEHVFLIRVQDGQAAFHYLPELKGTRRFASLELTMKPLQTSTEELVHLLAEKLSQTGLFHDEALAMARTWQRGYFQDEGLRVLYVIPRETIDRELPLAVAELAKTPTRVRVVRTFVGRLELLTPEKEAEIERAARDLTRGTPAARELARAKIAGWGRFAIPYLNRVRTLTDDQDVITTVRDELKELAKKR